MGKVPPSRVSILRAAESECLQRGVEAMTLAGVARFVGASLGAVASLFHDESALLDAVLERHQTPYERAWDDTLDRIEAPRDVLRLLVSSIARVVHNDDGGPAYVSIVAQMCTSRRFPLIARTATTTPSALKLMGKLTPATEVPFALVPIRFERIALVLFSSVCAWYRHGAARLPEELFIEDLTDTLAFLALAPPSTATQALVTSL